MSAWWLPYVLDVLEGASMSARVLECWSRVKGVKSVKGVKGVEGVEDVKRATDGADKGPLKSVDGWWVDG